MCIRGAEDKAETTPAEVEEPAVVGYTHLYPGNKLSKTFKTLFFEQAHCSETQTHFMINGPRRVFKSQEVVDNRQLWPEDGIDRNGQYIRATNLREGSGGL